MMDRSVKTDNPVDLLFGDLDKLGPGSDVHSLHILRLLPKTQFEVVVDAGCGTGRQTMVLARELGTVVHAVDSHEPFLKTLGQRGKGAGIERLVEAHCMDMQNIPSVFPRIDLLWSEGAAYNIGFANALATWATAIVPGGFAVVSELSWLREQAPVAVREFFESGYPGMQSIPKNVETAKEAGYTVLATHTLPGVTWVEGYYDALEPRAKTLLHHADPSVREFAAETIREIEIFHQSENSYGYVFYVLQRT